MPIEVAIWRMGAKPTRLGFSPLEFENRLEDLLASDLSIVDPGWLLIGRQVPTAFGKLIDLLALDAAGNLIVIELKRDRTPREVVAQLLDYGSWVRTLEEEDLAAIFAAYQHRHRPESPPLPLAVAFRDRFRLEDVPETLNESHRLVVVASELDDSTERIITYLAEEYGVAVNAAFFRFFRDGDREYLTRAWLKDPGEVAAHAEAKREKLPWNGEYYVSFGHQDDGNGRHWEDARQYGFISAGGGKWYVQTLDLLEPGGRVWVNVPGRGYVGVGTIVDGPTKACAFHVPDVAGQRAPITAMPLRGKLQAASSTEPDADETLVRVEWLKAVPVEEAIREKGLFGNQNSVAQPRSAKWAHTVELLKNRFGIS